MKRVQIQAKDVALRKAVAEGEEFALFDGTEPIARVVPLAAEVRKNAARLKHYPHDPAECLYTCWRHKDQPKQAAASDEAAPAAEAETGTVAPA